MSSASNSTESGHIRTAADEPDFLANGTVADGSWYRTRAFCAKLHYPRITGGLLPGWVEQRFQRDANPFFLYIILGETSWFSSADERPQVVNSNRVNADDKSSLVQLAPFTFLRSPVSVISASYWGRSVPEQRYSRNRNTNLTCTH